MTTADQDAAQLAVDATKPGHEAATATVPRRAAILTLVVVCAAVFLTALDQTVVVAALAPIGSSFSIDLPNNLSSLSWVVSGYLLGYVIVMPLMGRVSDLYGRQRILLGCLGLFAIGSLLCVQSQWLADRIPVGLVSVTTGDNHALSWLIIARFIQAVGGGAVVPVAIASIGDLFGEQRRILALGIIGGVTEAGGALGPLYGALILQRWTFTLPGYEHPWQWIFLLNIPIVLVLVAALALTWPRTASTSAQATGLPRGRIDWVGAALLGGALFCTSLGLGQSAVALTSLKGAQASQNNPLLVLAALVLLAGFIAWEAFQRDPVVALALFRSRAFSAGAIFNLLLGMALNIALVDIPIYILDVLTLSSYLDAGLALLRMTIMIPIGAFAGGWLVARVGTRVVGVAGALFTAAGFLVMHQWGVNLNWTLITIGTLIAGTGFGLIVAPISTSALNTAPRERFGMAASIVTALRMIGMILGLAALSAWGVSRFQYLVGNIAIPAGVTDINQITNIVAQQTTAITVKVVTDFFLAGAVLALVAIIPALFLWKPQTGDETRERVVIGV
ncbi:MAG: MFS transporter [Ktedonobacterales bacterium]|nr:MFS transporter [Ktedonobacterales bacterium]